MIPRKSLYFKKSKRADEVLFLFGRNNMRKSICSNRIVNEYDNFKKHKCDNCVHYNGRCELNLLMKQCKERGTYESKSITIRGN